MKIHEYQAKEILARYGVPVPRGRMALTVDEARRSRKNSAASVVVKAQIHAGGRGKGGGVKLADDAAAAERSSPDKILGMTLVTHQTGPEGRLVKRLLMEETLPIAKELYLGIVLDRASGKPVMMASSAGGMDIEDVAAKTPELILKETFAPGFGLLALAGPQTRLRHRHSRGQRHRRGQNHAGARPVLSRHGHVAGRNQSAGR